MKIVLAYLSDFADRNDYFLTLLPSGLISIAAYLDKHSDHSVVLANYSNIGHRKAVAELIKEKPDILGVSVYTHNRIESFHLISEYKKVNPNVRIIIGGPHASALSELILKKYPQIDFIIQGEGEDAFLSLVNKINNSESVSNPIIKCDRIKDLSKIPGIKNFKGKLVGIDPNEQFKFLISSRGCAYKCTFCDSPYIWGNDVQYRSAESLVDEIEYLQNRYGIIYFSIRDDNFTLNKKRVMDFCELIVSKKIFIMWNCQSRVNTIDEEMLLAMKKAGLEHIQYGIESGSLKILQEYDKRISLEQVEETCSITRKVGVYLSIYLMAGMWNETHADIKKTIHLIHKILPGDGIVSPVAYYPGTKIYFDAVEKGVISDEIWFKNRKNGIFLRENDKELDGWIDEILHELDVIRIKSWYKANDFVQHKKNNGNDCWVTDILEGDYFLDIDNFFKAEDCYKRIVKKHPLNYWGYLRIAKVSFLNGDYEAAEENLKKVVTLAGNYYGGWLKLAETLVVLGRINEASEAVERAYLLNTFDQRIINLKSIIKTKLKNKRI